MAGGGSSEMAVLKLQMRNLMVDLEATRGERELLASRVLRLESAVGVLVRQVAGLQSALRGGDVVESTTRAGSVEAAAARAPAPAKSINAVRKTVVRGK